MSYNTVQQFLSYSITSGSFDAQPTDVVQAYLDSAANRIDSAIIGRVDLPFASGAVPPIVLSWERDIAAFGLWMSMGANPGDDTNRNAWIEHRYREIVGDGINADSGELGFMAFGRRALVQGNDQAAQPNGPSYRVVGGKRRGWYARRHGRDVLT